MKIKIVVILMCMLLIATALPTLGIMNKEIEGNMSPLQSSGIEWEKTYGGDQADKLRDIEETDDGYIACGSTEISNNLCPWVMKVDSDGNEEWNWTITEFFHNDTYLEIDYCKVDDVHPTTDGGYIADLSLVTFYESIEYLFGGLVKLDANGIEEWITILADGFEWTIVLEDIMEIEDGYLLVGYYKDPLRADKDYATCMCKTNSFGEIQWHTEYIDGDFSDEVRGFCATSDGGYLLAGETQISEVPFYFDAFMIKTDADGNEQWTKTFGGSNINSFTEVFQTSDDDYILAGWTDRFGAGSYDGWILKTDSTGNELWNKTFGEEQYDAISDLDATEDDHYIFPIYIGWGASADSWVVLIDSDGIVEWKWVREYISGGPGSQYFLGISSTNDGGCIASGSSGLWDGDNSDALLVKYGPFPQLDIEITGGLGIKALVTNNGLGDATGVPYELTVTGGLLGLINKTVNGTIDIESGATKSISSGLLLGLGKIKTTVKVGVKEETFEGTQFLIFTLI